MTNPEIKTSDRILDRIMSDSLGTKIESKVALTGGTINEVYAVKALNLEDEVILKISPHSPNEHPFGPENWALAQCEERGVKVPKVISTGQIEDVYYSIQSKLPGISMKHYLERYPERTEEIAALTSELGETLSAMHTIETGGFGPLDAKGNGPSEKPEWLSSLEYLSLSNMLTIADSMNLSRKIINSAFEILTDVHFSDGPVLIHNDLLPGNIHVDDKKNRLSGLLDFERIEGGDPVKDFANWKLFENGEANLSNLLKGYGEQRGGMPDLEKRLRLWDLSIKLQKIEYYSKRGSLEERQEFIDILTAAVKSFGYET